MCDEEKMAMRANARARLSAALNNPADGLVLARWEDYQRIVNLKEELVLIPNIKDFKTMATQITDINFMSFVFSFLSACDMCSVHKTKLLAGDP